MGLVSFETIMGDKGLKATNIKVLSKRKPYERSPKRSPKRSPQSRPAASSPNDIAKRLVEVLSDENAPDGPLLTRDETDYILTGR
jgi:hypothetical protein